MAAPIPPITVTPHTEIELEDSCNCCWGRRQTKPPLKRSDAEADLFAEQLADPSAIPVRDAHEVYNLNVNVTVQENAHHSRRKSSGHSHTHDPKK